jgi:hypothetical protein
VFQEVVCIGASSKAQFANRPWSSGGHIRQEIITIRSSLQICSACIDSTFCCSASFVHLRFNTFASNSNHDNECALAHSLVELVQLKHCLLHYVSYMLSPFCNYALSCECVKLVGPLLHTSASPYVYRWIHCANDRGEGTRLQLCCAT